MAQIMLIILPQQEQMDSVVAEAVQALLDTIVKTEEPEALE
jgi:hypothetical protein